MYFSNENLFSYYLLNLTMCLFIEYLISDPKKIWINLELYFESYEFFNF